MIKKIGLLIFALLAILATAKSAYAACSEGDSYQKGRSCYECVYIKRLGTTKWKGSYCATAAEASVQAVKASENAYKVWLAGQTAAANLAAQEAAKYTTSNCKATGCSGSQYEITCYNELGNVDHREYVGSGCTVSLGDPLTSFDSCVGQQMFLYDSSPTVAEKACGKCQPTKSTAIGSCGTSGTMYIDDCGGYDCVIDEEEQAQRQVSCSPACTPACGQGDLCGGTCGTGDKGNPAAPTLTPANGGTVSADENGQVTVSWTAVGKAEQYELELYPSGTSCSDPAAFCNTISALSYSFTPQVSTYSFRVRGVNTSCGSQLGAWAGPAVFSVNSFISGQVKLDLAGEASIVGGVCVLSGAPGAQPGSGSRIIVDSTYTGTVNASGNYSVSVPAGVRTAVLVPGASEWRCTCPVGCAYSTITPKTGLDYFVSNFSNSWFQVQGGSLHANAGGITSSIPASCDLTPGCLPYLITAGSGGVTGAASYAAGSINLGEVDSDHISEGANWHALTNYQGTKTGYDYFARILQEDPSGVGEWNGAEPTQTGVFLASGVNEIIGTPWTIPSGQATVLLVPNDLTIKTNIDVAQGGFLAIISSGNLEFGDEVTHVEGVYIADGTIATCESDICGTGGISDKFTGEGIFVGWQGFDLRRDFYSDVNNGAPAELFVYRPDLQVNAYRYLLNPKFAWQEVAP